MKLIRRYFLTSSPTIQKWTPPRDFLEFQERYPSMLPTMGRNALSKLQQGKFHASDQVEDLVGDLQIILLTTNKIGNFDLRRHPRTPENGFKAYMWMVINSLTKNWVMNQNYFHIPIDNPEANPGCNCLPETCLPASTLENPYEDFMKMTITTAAEAKIQRFLQFVLDMDVSCQVTLNTIALVSFGDLEQLSEVQRELGLSDKDKSILRTKIRELWDIFTLQELKARDRKMQ